jgi:hypothetical protein
VKIAIYIVALPIAFGVVAFLLFNGLAFVAFVKDRIVFDEIIAMNNLRSAMALTGNPLSQFTIGCLLGLAYSGVSIGFRLLNGRWPHED